MCNQTILINFIYILRIGTNYLLIDSALRLFLPPHLLRKIDNFGAGTNWEHWVTYSDILQKIEEEKLPMQCGVISQLLRLEEGAMMRDVILAILITHHHPGLMWLTTGWSTIPWGTWIQ